MKKILLALGTTTSIIAPVVGVIACGATKKPETPQPIIVDKPKPPVSSTTVPGGTTQAPVVQPITSGTGTSG
ncbi:MAG: hypothetical protein KAG04_01905, partial [Mycoplasmataceae bacterium]|nr:hypothetical protein [Mycoplasmataceae bacterium]